MQALWEELKPGAPTLDPRFIFFAPHLMRASRRSGSRLLAAASVAVATDCLGSLKGRFSLQRHLRQATTPQVLTLALRALAPDVSLLYCCYNTPTLEEALMTREFGELLQNRRAELRLSLRDFAVRANMDPGNLSRIERGRVAPPQDPEVLARLVDALELTGTVQGQELVDVASMQNGRIPRDILSNEEVMSALPVLLRTVNNKQLDGARIERLINMIRNA